MNKEVFENLHTDDWDIETFKCYINFLNMERFGEIPAEPSPLEIRMLEVLIRTEGKAVTKEFIALCVETYLPKGDYSSVNFFFMFMYMREWNLPLAKELIYV